MVCCCNQKLLINLRRKAILIQEPQWFAGTIYDNVVLNAKNINVDIVLEKLAKVGIIDRIMSCKDGLLTFVSSWQYEFTEREAVLIMILRVLVNSSRLVIIDRTLDLLSADEIANVLTLLFAQKDKTFIITSQRFDFPKIKK